MARRDVVCPICGKLLGGTTSTRGGGSLYCNKCRKNIRWDATPDGVYTSVR